MPQSPFGANVAVDLDNPLKRVPLVRDTDTGGLLISGSAFAASGGAASSALGVTAPLVLKAEATRLVCISVIHPGTAGSFSIHDAPTVEACDDGNTLWTAPFDALSVGMVINLDLPTGAGLTVGNVTTGGQLTVGFGTTGGPDQGGTSRPLVYLQADPPVGALVGALWADGSGNLSVLYDDGAWVRVGYGW